MVTAEIKYRRSSLHATRKVLPPNLYELQTMTSPKDYQSYWETDTSIYAALNFDTDAIGNTSGSDNGSIINKWCWIFHPEFFHLTAITKTQEHDGLQDKRHIINERRLRRRLSFKRRTQYYHIAFSTRHDPMSQPKDDTTADGDHLLKYAVTIECTTTSYIQRDTSGMFPLFRCDEYVDATIDPASQGNFIRYDGEEAPVSHPATSGSNNISSNSGGIRSVSSSICSSSSGGDAKQPLVHCSYIPVALETVMMATFVIISIIVIIIIGDNSRNSSASIITRSKSNLKAQWWR
jgi:hypothetical protein